MKKAEAREIAIDFFTGAWDSYYSILSKCRIDDMGTLSKEGYDEIELEIIKKELDFLIKKVLKCSLKPHENK